MALPVQQEREEEEGEATSKQEVNQRHPSVVEA
jgi:hypothetical protein